jgi:hypothetical protein
VSTLTRECRAILNPALGSVLIWRFCVGYYEQNRRAAAMPLPMAFLVLPILLHEQTARLVSSTQRASGLRKFAEKFSSSAEAKTDLLLALGSRARRMRPLTLESLRLAFYGSLLGLDSNSGGIFPLSTTAPAAGIPESVRPMLANAEKLGTWCSQLTPYEVGLALKVRF